MEVLISCQTGTQGEDNGEDSCSKFSKKKKKLNKKEREKKTFSVSYKGKRIFQLYHCVHGEVLHSIITELYPLRLIRSIIAYVPLLLIILVS